MKILHANDLHFATRNPASRLDDYNEELFSCLDLMSQLVDKLDIAAICLAGDLFHDKDRAPWGVVVRLLQWANRTHAKILVIPGNHDMKYDLRNSVVRTPFGVLVESGLFIDVSQQPFLLCHEDAERVVYGIPWPEGGTPEAYTRIPPEAELVLAHGWATPEGEPRYGNWCAKYDELARQAPRVRLWHFGHDHSDHGVYRLKNGAQVVNIGALSRGSLDTDNLTRQVKVALSDWSTPEVTVMQIALPVAPPDQVFDIKARAAKVRERQALEQFVQQFATGLAGAVAVGYQDVLAQTPLDAAVRTKVEAYIAAAEEAV